MQHLTKSCVAVIYFLLKHNIKKSLVMLLTLLCSSYSLPQFSGGSGTPADPYQVRTVKDLRKITYYSAGNFILLNDIEMDGNPENGIQGYPGWLPIGYYHMNGQIFAAPFSGVFDGNGHVIRDLYISMIDAPLRPHGLFSYVQGGIIKNLGLENVSIESVSQVGVLAGYIFNAQISNCYATGTVGATEDVVGGLVGYCRNSTIENCYSLVNVFSHFRIQGGLIGQGWGAIIQNSYFGGTLTNDEGSPGNEMIGSDIGGSVVINSMAGSGATLSNAMAAGWDLVNESANGTNDYWNWNGNLYLSWQDGSGTLIPSIPFEGTGSTLDPFQILTPTQLYQIRNYGGKHFILMNDIDLAGYSENDTSGQNFGWLPIGTDDYGVQLNYLGFSGSLDGNGHVIRNLTTKRISTQDTSIRYFDGTTASIKLHATGLFGSLSGAEIKNLGLENVYIEGMKYTGALAGLSVNGTTISNCYSTGHVLSRDVSAGGLIGENNNFCTVDNCYSKADVFTHNSKSGGLVAQNSGTIINCYSTGSVTSDNPSVTLIGGFMGESAGTLTNSFWDTQASGMLTSAGGTGLSTSAAKTLSSYLNAGWDFENEISNGTNNYWDMDTMGNYNDGYPYLSWQDGPDRSLPVELATFTASVDGNEVNLKWQTISEKNNYGFEVERLKDYKITRLQDSENKWETIGFVKGNGNSNSLKEYTFSDEEVPGGNYIYRLKQIDNDGSFTYSNNEEASLLKPEKFTLEQNYPNPFNPVTNFEYIITKQGFVSLKVYDILGKEIKTLVNENKEPGKYKIKFDASGLSSGIYLYKLESNNQVQVRKMIVMK